MKKKGWIGFLMGVFFCLLMVMPSFVHADVTVSGGTESSMVDLEGINNGSVTPGTFTTQSGTTRNAYVTDSGAVNTGDNAAILTNANGWSVNVSSSGLLTGGNYGVLFDDDGNNPYLNGTLTNYGSISGGTHGALMNYGTITNYGSLTAGIGSGAIFWSEGTGTATVINSGTMSGGDNGLEFYNPSTGTMTAIVTNNAGGTMSGYYNGIEFYSAGSGTATITNSGTITGTDGGDGIYLYSDGALTTRIQNNFGGTIDGYYDGIHFESDGAGAATITNAGTITGDWGNGVYLWSDGAGTFAVNNSGTIASYDEYSGLYIGSDAGTGTATVTNSGLISAHGDGIGIEYLDSATVTNNAGGIIESDWYNGLLIYDVGTVNVNNTGTIVSYDDDNNGYNHPAIYIHGVAGTATVNNNAGGNIQAVDGEGVYIEYANTAMINNYGTIQSSDSKGVYTYEVETVTVNNYAGGLIQSDDSGEGVYIEYANTAMINNYGKINGVCETGVYIDGVGTATVNNYAGGLILGEEEEAIEIYADTVTVNNYGRIEGMQEAVYIEDAETATVNNNGTIVSSNSYGIYYNGEDYGAGMVTVTNNAGGLIQADDDGVYIGYADTATVTNNAGGSIQSYNGRGIAMEYIGGSATAKVINSGLIQAYNDGVYIGYADTATVTNNAGGFIQSGSDDGIDIEYADTATVTNYGTIQGDDDGIHVDYVDTATVTNYGTITGTNDEGIDVEEAETATVTNSGNIQAYYSGIEINGPATSTSTANVTNNAGGFIQSNYNDGIYIEDVGTTTVTNSGIIQGSLSDYAGLNIENVETATVTNNAGGFIQGYNDGIHIEYVGKATATNSGTIQGSYDGLHISNTTTANVGNSGNIQGGYEGLYIWDLGTFTVTNSGTITGDQYGAYIYDVGTLTVTNSGTIQSTNGTGMFIRADANDASVDVTNSGMISSTNDKGVYIRINGVNENTTLTNTATGVISGGVEMVVSNIYSTGEITNSGIITSSGDGIDVTGYGQKTITNYAGGVIYGDVYGIRSINGPTTIFNYGTITGADGTAIRVNRSNNEVTLGTGSVINGDIRANYNYSDNYMILDGEGTIRADQMQQFGYLNKTGAGTWTLTGDMDYSSSYNYYGHSTTIEEGVLALGERGSVGGGVVTDSFTQNTGASLGYAVTATGSTGEVTVNGDADFGDGAIVVIPAAGTYAPETIYPSVLYVDGSIIVNGEVVADPTDPSWAILTSTSAFLRPSLLYNSGEYDLGLERLSFTTSADSKGNAALGAALDGMYDSATGDMRTLLDELIVLPSATAQTTLTQVSGGTHAVFQLLSFNGIGKYLGVLNNHVGTGGAFANNNQGTGFAWYGNDTQLAMAGGGNSMSDVAPVLLAAVGNVGQTQIAAGTNWGFWIDGYASIGNRRSDEMISKYKQTLIGGMLGFDIRATDNLFLGISGGISRTKLEFDDLMDNGYMNSYHGSVYLCYNGRPWYAEGVFSYARNSYDLERFITIGSDTVIANSDYYGNEYNGYAEVGYKFDAGGVIIRPLAAFQMDYLTQDAFKETGAGVLDLDVEKRTTGSHQSFLGINVSGPIKIGSSAVLTPELRLKWAHEFSNDGHLINARFEGQGSGSFTIETEQLSRDTAVAGVGLSLRINKNMAAYVQYDAELNRDFINHTGLLGLRFDW